MADEARNEFLTNAPKFREDAPKIIELFEALSDDEQHAVELNLMHLYSRTPAEIALWNHINENGLRIDR